LSLEVDGGDVEVEGSDQPRFEIAVLREVTRASEAEAAAALTNHHVTIERVGNRIHVHARRVNVQTGWWKTLFGQQPALNVRFQIRVPTRFNAKLGTAGGDIRVSKLQGGADLNTGGGDLRLDGVEGSVRAQTSGGDIRLAGSSGSLDLHTSGGQIEVKKFSGSWIRAETSGGNILAELAASPREDCSLRAGGGSVRVALAADMHARIDASARGGDVSSDVPVQSEGERGDGVLKGTINGGGATVLLRSSGGDIHLAKLKQEP